jgi:hypothetical protein
MATTARPPARRRAAKKVAPTPRASWEDLDDYTESQNWFIYSDTGAGKTALIRQLPGRVGILASENGTVVLKRIMLKIDGKDDSKRFKVWRILKWQDMEDAFIWIRDNLDSFDWLVMDTATSIQHRAMRAAMEAAVLRSPEKRDIDLPDRGEHQKMQNAMKRMITDFNELPVNCLWLAQAMRRESFEGEDIVLPFIMGKDYEVSAWACAQMHVVAYYEKRAAKVGDKVMTKRVLLFDSFDREGVQYWAKDRYLVLPKQLTIAIGDTQKGSIAEMIALIDADPEARERANANRRTDVERTSIDRHLAKEPPRKAAVKKVAARKVTASN